MAEERPQRRVLIVDPDGNRAEELVGLAERFSCRARSSPNADAAWPAFAELRPDVVLLGLEPGDDSAETFFRRLQTQYMGTMPPVYYVGPPDLTASSVLEPDGLLVPPLGSDALLGVFRPELEIGDTAARQITRLRELFELTALSSDLIAGLDVLVARASLTFRVENCLVWGPGDDGTWPRVARSLLEPERTEIMQRARQALDVRATMVVGAGGRAQARSYLAAPLIGRTGEASRGGICLVDGGGRLFSIDERDALRSFARRIAAELTFVSAHIRLLRAHNELRETALLDPLLGVWTRAAFESAVARQIASSQRRGEPLFLAVLDFVRLRAINDRWGHLAGDAVLAHLARTVRDNLRPQDQLGRFGGDELAILLVGGDLTAAEEAMTALLQALATAPFERGGLSVPLEVAIGLTPMLEDEASGERAFARALSALRRARQARQPLAVASGERDRSRTGSETSVVFEVGAYSGIPSGSTIGGMYRILHEISRGAMGVVYRGEDLGLGRPVAIKVLRADLARDRGLVARFREEAAVLASLRHRNLVQVYAFGEDGDDVFFVMELVEGEPLSDVIDRLAPSGALVALDAVCKIVEEIAEALEAMHAARIIHRDVKPANVLLDRINDRAVLVDVGVARRAHEATDAAGTPGFAAPESFTDTPESAATDVYGLATTAYAMLTGGPPFGAGEVVSMVNRQLFEPVPPISSRRRGLSAELDTLMARALAAEPEDRHRSANAFAIALTRALTGDTGFEQASTLAKVPAPVVARADTGSGARFETAPITGRGPSPLDRDESSVGESHGAFFSVARRLLSHQIGEQATRRIAASSLTLTRLLDNGLSATGWRPIEDLLELLAGMAAHIDAPRFAFRLGRSMISATLTHTFGADPRSVPALDLIRAAPSYWPRYHRWGRLTMEANEPRVATVVLEDKPDDPLLCALVGGMLVRIPELAGSSEAAVSHPRCVSQGASRCRFRLGY